MSGAKQFVEALARAYYESVREPHMKPFDEVEPDPRTGSDSRAGFRIQAARYLPARQPTRYELQEASRRLSKLAALHTLEAT